MTASEQKTSPDFFEDHSLDPLAAATGNQSSRRPLPKKKAGFYLSEQVLQRFNRRFHQMKLDGAAIGNKSALVEIALNFALDDLDQGENSQIGAALKQA